MRPVSIMGVCGTTWGIKKWLNVSSCTRASPRLCRFQLKFSEKRKKNHDFGVIYYGEAILLHLAFSITIRKVLIRTWRTNDSPQGVDSHGRWAPMF